MRTLSIKSLIDFRGKSDAGKKNFAAALRLSEPVGAGSGGGNYWISCLSAISRSFKKGDLQPIVDRRVELEDRCECANHERIKTTYGRNIDILYNYEDVELDRWRPAKRMVFLKRDRGDSILTIRGLPVLAAPDHVFSFGRGEPKEVGSIWFVTKLEGVAKEELGMFTDLLYRYLRVNFSREYTVNRRYCIAVDIVNDYDLSYAQLEKDETPLILNATLDEVKSFM